MSNKAIQLIKSRKFWASVVGLAIVIASGLDENFPLTAEHVEPIVYLLVAYILGTGVEDSGLMGRLLKK